jgi:hypothetical protein
VNAFEVFLWVLMRVCPDFSGSMGVLVLGFALGLDVLNEFGISYRI